jgi:hypothetical protein
VNLTAFGAQGAFRIRAQDDKKLKSCRPATEIQRFRRKLSGGSYSSLPKGKFHASLPLPSAT